MEKIQFKNNEAPYLSAENLNQLQTNMETAISEEKQQDITTDGEPVKCGYKIDGKDVYVVRRSFETSGSTTNNSKGVSISDLGYSDIIKVDGKTNQGFLLGGAMEITYDANNLVIWFNNQETKSYSGYINIYFIK